MGAAFAGWAEAVPSELQILDVRSRLLLEQHLGGLFLQFVPLGSALLLLVSTPILQHFHCRLLGYWAYQFH